MTDNKINCKVKHLIDLLFIWQGVKVKFYFTINIIYNIKK